MGGREDGRTGGMDRWTDGGADRGTERRIEEGTGRGKERGREEIIREHTIPQMERLQKAYYPHVEYASLDLG